MGIDAVALLRVRPASLDRDQNHAAVLCDGVVLRTHARWSEDTEELAFLVRSAAGSALDEHDDPRGVLVFPEGLMPTAPSYERAVEELVAKGAAWVPRVDEQWLPERLRDAEAGSLEAIARELHEAVPPELLARLQRAMASGDQADASALQEELERAVQHIDLEAYEAALQRSLESAPLRVSHLAAKLRKQPSIKRTTR